MKRIINLFLFFVALLIGCKVNLLNEVDNNSNAYDFDSNNLNGSQVFKLQLDYKNELRSISLSESAFYEDVVFLPESFQTTLESEESTTEVLSALLPESAVPQKADILFAFDLTGSMGNSVKQTVNNASNIMKNLRTLIPDTYFGVVSHKDHNVEPFGSLSDYAYQLETPITDNAEYIFEAMSGFNIGGGRNDPESYSYVCYQAYSDPSIGWRENSKKFVVFWLDNLPHAKDPGPDGIPNTSDDLTIDEVLQGLKQNNITLIVLCSGSSSICSTWNEYAARTGGAVYAINSSTDIASVIAQSVTEQTKKISRLSLSVHEKEYTNWLTNVNPINYEDIILDSEKTFDFDVEYKVPKETEDGVYKFTVNLVGDGAVYATHDVEITVKNNKPPVAIIGDDIVLEQLTPEGTMHTLDAKNSYDPENDELIYSWECNGIKYEGALFTHIFAEGENIVTLTVIEKERGKSSVATAKITVVDTIPPNLYFERQEYWWMQDIFDNRFIFVVKANAVDYVSNDITISATCIQEFSDGTKESCTTKVTENSKVYFQLANDGKSRYRNFYLTITATDKAGNSTSKTEVFRRLP
ncbi:MAG: hypothetical protein J6I73_07195 [Treponema sp.]|nr:hypothetical protein [Treponema sp.]